MKRDKKRMGSLEAFKARNLKENNSQQIEQLLGQILGDCHDGKVSHKYSKADNHVQDNVRYN